MFHRHTKKIRLLCLKVLLLFVIGPALMASTCYLPPPQPCIYNTSTGQCIDSLLILDTDSLQVSVQTASTWSYQWVIDSQPLIGANGPSLTLKGGYPSGKYACHLIHPSNFLLNQETSPMWVEIDEGVKPGDTNKDGKVDLLDLLAISLGFGQTGPPRPFPITNPADTTLSPGWDWPSGSCWNNLKHADCNGDGLIDSADVEVVKAQAQPAALVSAFQSPVLNGPPSSPGTIKLEMAPTPGPPAWTTNGDLVLSFTLTVGDLPPGLQFLDVKGLTLTNPLTESSNYSIRSVHTEYTTSDLTTDPSELITADMFYNTTPIQPLSGNNCAGSTSYPSEIAVFHKTSTFKLIEGRIVGVCIVVLEDIYAPLGGPGGPGVPDSVPILIASHHPLIYTQSSNGSMEVYSIRCQMDTLWIDLSGHPGGNGSSSKSQGTPFTTNSPAIQIFPNPVNQGLPLTLRSSDLLPLEVRLELYDLNGKQVHEWNEKRTQQVNELTLPTNGLQLGMYHLRVTGEGLHLQKNVIIHSP